MKMNRTDYEFARALLDNKELFKDSSFLGQSKIADRHRDEFRLWLDGNSYASIAKRYGVSTELIRVNVIKTGYILNVYRERRNEPDLPSLPDPDIEFTALLERAALETDSSRVGLVPRARNGFDRFCRSTYPNATKEERLDILKSMDTVDLFNIRNIGPRSVRILFRAQEILREEEKENDGREHAGAIDSQVLGDDQGSEGESNAGQSDHRHLPSAGRKQGSGTRKTKAGSH